MPLHLPLQPLLIFQILLLSNLPTLAPSLTQPFNISQIQPVAVGRLNSIFTTSPINRALRANPHLEHRLRPVYSLFRTLHSVILTRRTLNDTTACNLHAVTWVRSSLNNVRLRQLGQYANVCQSRLNLNNAVVRNELNSTFVRSVNSILVEAQNALWQAFRLSDATFPPNEARNWTRGYFQTRAIHFSRNSQTCNVNQFFAYHVNNIWYTLAFVTNNPLHAFMPDWQRQFIYEFIPEQLPNSLTLPWIKFGTDHVVENGTTFLTRWAGKAGLSAVSAMDVDDNPALEEAFRLNALAVDQAEDAITPSNIAILALPMLMSLIPVAVLADLNTCAMLWYIIFTDLFSALPFLIKGVELLNSTSAKRREVVAYHMGNETLGQMEVWAAECRGQDNFRVLGIAFIAIGTASILFGVSLELIAIVIVQKRFKENGYMDGGPFGMALLETTAFSILGRAGEDERDRRAMEEISQLAGFKCIEEEHYEDGTFFNRAEIKEQIYGNHDNAKQTKPRQWWHFAGQQLAWWQRYGRQGSGKNEEGANEDEVTPAAGRSSASASTYDAASL